MESDTDDAATAVSEPETGRTRSKTLQNWRMNSKSSGEV